MKLHLEHMPDVKNGDLFYLADQTGQVIICLKPVWTPDTVQPPVPYFEAVECLRELIEGRAKGDVKRAAGEGG